MGTVSTLTIGSNTYSVYALTADPVNDANDYFSARLGSDAWTDASTANKKRALVSAVRFLDRAVTWSGEQTDTVTPQPLQWPRDGAACSGVAVADGTTPDAFANAEFEQALIFLDDATEQSSTGTGSNVKRVKAGSAEVEFFTGTAGTGSETRLPTVVNDLVGCYIESSGISGGAWGTTEVVDYSKDDFDLSQGLP
jgi:hypothetical protein